MPHSQLSWSCPATVYEPKDYQTIAPAVERHQFGIAVTKALRHLHDAARLSNSLLIRCEIVRSVRNDDAVITLRRTLIQEIAEMSRETATADQARLLVRRFLATPQPQALLAEALHMGASTLRRRLQRATALLVAQLWSRELRQLYASR